MGSTEGQAPGIEGGQSKVSTVSGKKCEADVGTEKGKGAAFREQLYIIQITFQGTLSKLSTHDKRNIC